MAKHSEVKPIFLMHSVHSTDAEDYFALLVFALSDFMGRPNVESAPIDIKFLPYLILCYA